MAVTFYEPCCGLLVNVNCVIKGEEDKEKLIETKRERTRLGGRKIKADRVRNKSDQQV